ncbi:MAG: restriction endonuclease [Chloroflexi bacterium]|nr:restriction endonuclease [Chloroflexota bacterium]
MAENASWRMGELLRIVILFLWDKPAGASTREIMEAIAKSTPLSAEETSPVPDEAGFSRYEVTTRAAMTALEKAGWLAREKSRWLLTEEGQLACKDFRQASDFYIESQRIFENWRLNRPAIYLTIEYAREKAWEQIRRFLQNLTHYEFLSLVRDLLTAMGYYLEWIAPPGKKRGHIDMVVVPEPLRANQQRIMVQIKHAGQVITAEGLESQVSAIYKDTLVLCVSSGGFTEKAKEYASIQAPHKAVLMNLERFVDLWVEHYDKLTPDARQRFPIEAIHFLSLNE